MSWPTSADIVSGAFSTVHFVASLYNQNPTTELNIPTSEQNMDPLALRISLSIRAFLPDGKPTLKKEGQVIWDSSNPLTLGNASFERQGCDRSYNGDYSSRKITILWPKSIKWGNQWYSPSAATRPFDIDSAISQHINREALEEQTKTYRANYDKEDSGELKEKAFKELIAHEHNIAVLAERAKVELEQKQKRQQQIYNIFSISKIGLKKTAETYLKKDLQEDTALKERLEKCAKLIETGLTHSEDPKESVLNPEFVKKLQNIWDDKTIDKIHQYFVTLAKLEKDPTIMNRQHADNIIKAIEAIVSEKCTKFKKKWAEQSFL